MYKRLVAVSILALGMFTLSFSSVQAAVGSSFSNSANVGSVYQYDNIVLTAVLTNTDPSVTYEVHNCNLWRSPGSSVYPVALTISAPSGSSTYDITFFGGATAGEIPVTTLVNGARPQISPGQAVTYTMTVSAQPAAGTNLNLYFTCMLQQGVTILGTAQSNAVNVAIVSPAAPAPVPAPAPAPTPAPSSEPTPTPAVDPGITLPTGFSSTTLSTRSSGTITNLDISVAEGAGVVFNSSFNLDSEELKAKLQNISQYVDIGPAYISVDSTNFPELNVPSTIKLKFSATTVDTIMIFKDGEDYTAMVTNLSYDPGTQIVSFDVTGFSRYEVVDVATYNLAISGSSQVIVEDTTASNDSNQTLVFALVGVAIVLVAALGAGVWWMRKSKAQVTTTTTAAMPVAPTPAPEATLTPVSTAAMPVMPTETVQVTQTTTSTPPVGSV